MMCSFAKENDLKPKDNETIVADRYGGPSQQINVTRPLARRLQRFTSILEPPSSLQSPSILVLQYPYR